MCSRFGTATVLLGILCAGCHDPTEGVVDSGASDAKQAVDSASDRSAAAVSIPLDAENCDIKWTGSNTAGQTPYGYFYGIHGEAAVDANSGELHRITLEFAMDEVKAMDSSLTEKLQHKGFFEVDKFPISTFVSTSIKAGARDGDPPGTTHVVEANFQLRDVTKSITIPVQVSFEGNMLSLSSEFKINRRDYGVIYSDSAGDALIRDNVLINVSVTASR